MYGLTLSIPEATTVGDDGGLAGFDLWTKRNGAGHSIVAFSGQGQGLHMPHEYTLYAYFLVVSSAISPYRQHHESTLS